MRRLAAIAMCATLALATTVPAAAAATRTRIGPHQLFIGFVNGHRPTATVNMACFGPVRPGQTGHPMSGQTVSVQRSVDIPGGNTGAAGNAVVVTFTPTTSTAAGLRLTRYGSVAIPTTLTLPCAGGGTALFTPLPGSSTARPDQVQVNYLGQP